MGDLLHGKPGKHCGDGGRRSGIADPHVAGADQVDAGGAAPGRQLDTGFQATDRLLPAHGRTFGEVGGAPADFFVQQPRHRFELVVDAHIDNNHLGVDVTAMVAGLGIGGIAIGLALQNVLKDTFASLAIILDKPFEEGDFIVVGDLSGTVERIGLKTTRVRALGGEQLVFGNDDLLSSRVRNFARLRERRVLLLFGIVYQTPADVVEAIPAWIREIVEAQPQARFCLEHETAWEKAHSARSPAAS